MVCEPWVTRPVRSKSRLAKSSPCSKPRSILPSGRATPKGAPASSQPALDAGSGLGNMEPANGASTREPTYTDGSWSVEDVLSITPGNLVTVTGYVSEIYSCQPRPKGAHCKPYGPGDHYFGRRPRGHGRVAIRGTRAADFAGHSRSWSTLSIHRHSLEPPEPFVVPVTAHSPRYGSYGPVPAGLRRRSNPDKRSVESQN